MQMGAQVLALDRLYKNKKGTTNYNSPLPVNIAASSQTYKKFKETLHEHLNVCLFAVNLWKTWE
jgi:hypothetical protein